MRNLAHGVLVATLVLSTGSCKKDDLEVEELNTNPFDADYVGEPVFTTLDERTVPYTSGSAQLLRLEVDVRVNTALFPVPTAYGVLYRLPSGITVPVPTSELGDNEFTMTALDVTSGAQYCFLPRLTNNGGSGSGATICATAD